MCAGQQSQTLHAYKKSTRPQPPASVLGSTCLPAWPPAVRCVSGCGRVFFARLPVCSPQQHHTDSIYADDLWYFVGPVDVPDTNYYAGYSMRHINTVRICETYVSDECVLKRGADVCVEEQVRLRQRGLVGGRSMAGRAGVWLMVCCAVLCRLGHVTSGRGVEITGCAQTQAVSKKKAVKQNICAAGANIVCTPVCPAHLPPPPAADRGPDSTDSQEAASTAAGRQQRQQPRCHRGADCGVWQPAACRGTRSRCTPAQATAAKSPA